MKLERRSDGWWIVDTPEGVDEMGPYASRDEATQDRVGVQKFLDGAKITTDKVRK